MNVVAVDAVIAFGDVESFVAVFKAGEVDCGFVGFGFWFFADEFEFIFGVVFV